MSPFAELIRSRAETLCSRVRRCRNLPEEKNRLEFAWDTGRLVVSFGHYKSHCRAIIN